MKICVQLLVVVLVVLAGHTHGDDQIQVNDGQLPDTPNNNGEVNNGQVNNNNNNNNNNNPIGGLINGVLGGGNGGANGNPIGGLINGVMGGLTGTGGANRGAGAPAPAPAPANGDAVVGLVNGVADTVSTAAKILGPAVDQTGQTAGRLVSDVGHMAHTALDGVPALAHNAANTGIQVLGVANEIARAAGQRHLRG